MSDWREALDDYNLSRADAHVELERWTMFERSLLTEDELRNRRLLDDEERRCDGFFDRDRELMDDDEPE